MITGTLYYKKDDKFYTKDSSVCFSEKYIEEYTDEKLGDLYAFDNMFIVKIYMKLAYIQNSRYVKRLNQDSSLKGSKVLSKLKRKHKHKLEGNK